MGAQEEVAGPSPRVVFDTNVVVSALVFRGGRLAWLREAWSGRRVVPLVGRETLAELVRVLAYPRFGFDGEDAKSLLSQYLEHAETVSRVSARKGVPVCRDREDQKFLALAYAARADALVSCDRDLLALAGFSRIPILAPEAFRKLLDE
ncbi:MAG: putative toxin-antitoxin system toxin component, PIN family [Burkholderiales bacterium]